MSDRRPPTVSEDTMKKIMWLYRTRNCPLNKRGQCNYGARCFDSHEASPERRAPKQNEYNDWHPSTMKCTSNIPKESCKYGRACYFAHNDFEVNYHPTLYKSKLCVQFEKDGTCQLGMICPHYHYPEEQRKIEKGTISSDCKSDGLSRKAPPPQEFRRWLDEELRRAKVSTFSENSNSPMNGDSVNNHLDLVNGSTVHNANGNQLAQSDAPQQQLLDQKSQDIVDSILGDDHLLNNSKLIDADELNVNVLPNDNDNDHDDDGSNHLNNALSLDSDAKLGDEHKIDSINTQSVENGGDRERRSQPNIENEVEIELPSASHPLSNLSGPNLMLRNVSDSPSTRFMSPQIQSPFNGSEHDDKWHQKKKQSRPDQLITSPHMNRTLSTPSSLPSIPQCHQGTNFQSLAGPSSIYYSHSHGPISTASLVSARSNRSSNRSQRSGKSGRSKKSKKSGKSVHSDKTKSSRSSKKLRISSRKSSKKHDAKLSKNSQHHKHAENASNGKRRSLKKKSLRELQKKRERLERAALDIIKTYKVNECEATKCNDVFCVNYHSLEERRRDPFTINYCSEPCQRIFDEKQRKFLDNGYGCPMNDACEFAHNYLELWYHPNVFHTRKCPLIKYHKKCAWGFKCSHYHKKSHKRIRGGTYMSTLHAVNNGSSHNLSKQIQRGNHSPMSSSQFSSISHTHSYHSHNVTAVAPPNIPAQPQLTQPAHPHIAHPSPMGPHRPPLSNNRTLAKSSPSLHSHHHHLAHHHMLPSAHTAEMNAYSAMPHAFDAISNHTSFDVSAATPISNGLMSNTYEQHNAAKSGAHDSSYSYNPLMQGIAPSINSWRQKAIENNSTY